MCKHGLGADVTGALRLRHRSGLARGGNDHDRALLPSRRIVRRFIKPAEPVFGTLFERGGVCLQRGEPGVESRLECVKVIERRGADEDTRAAVDDGESLVQWFPVISASIRRRAIQIFLIVPLAIRRRSVQRFLIVACNGAGDRRVASLIKTVGITLIARVVIEPLARLLGVWVLRESIAADERISTKVPRFLAGEIIDRL